MIIKYLDNLSNVKTQVEKNIIINRDNKVIVAESKDLSIDYFNNIVRIDKTSFDYLNRENLWTTSIPVDYSVQYTFGYTEVELFFSKQSEYLSHLIQSSMFIKNYEELKLVFPETCKYLICNVGHRVIKNSFDNSVKVVIGAFAEVNYSRDVAINDRESPADFLTRLNYVILVDLCTK